jgi:hypothetical protein
MEEHLFILMNVALTCARGQGGVRPHAVQG